MHLAIESGITVETWLAGDPLYLETAIELLIERNEEMRRHHG